MSYFKPYVDAAGPHLPTYNDRMEKLLADYRSIFGQDLYLGEDTQDYQLCSLFCKALDDLSSLMLAPFSAMDPNLAEGQMLDLLVTLNGLTRNPGETDAELRLRHSLMLSATGSGTAQAMEDALRQVPYLQDVSIVENDTDAAFTDGQPAHSLRVIVRGGSSANVAKAILEQKPMGISTWGTTSSTVTDAFGNSRTVKFSRAKMLAAQVTVTLQTLEGYDAAKAEAMIREAVTDYFSGMKIGEPLMVPLITARIARLEDPEHPTFAVTGTAVSTSRGSSAVRMIPAADEYLWTDGGSVRVVAS